MSELVEIVEKVNQAFLDKDEATLRACLHENYRYIGPVDAMNIDGIEACIAMMRGFDLKPVNANSQWITQHNKVVEIFDWTLTDSVQCVVPMVEVTTFRDQRIASTQAFFNPALLPSLT